MYNFQSMIHFGFLYFASELQSIIAQLQMKEKKNIQENYHQLLMNIVESSTGKLASEDVKKAQLVLNLLMEDFEKSRSYLEQLERLSVAPLEFESLSKRSKTLIESLISVVERGIENYRYTGNILTEAYSQTIELEQAISESYNSIDRRFSFWLHSFVTGKTEEIPTFVDFVQHIGEQQFSYAYFLVPCGRTYLLVCQDIPDDTSPANLDIQFSTYVVSPEGSFQSLKRAWRKRFSIPDTILYHIFHRSHANASVGIFKRNMSVVVEPYCPHHHNHLEQLPKIIYDFINIYGIAGHRHVHLLKGEDRLAVLTTQHPVKFDDRIVLISGGNVNATQESSKDVYRLAIE